MTLFCRLIWLTCNGYNLFSNIAICNFNISNIPIKYALMINQYRDQITEGEESLTGIGGIVYEC